MLILGCDPEIRALALLEHEVGHEPRVVGIWDIPHLNAPEEPGLIVNVDNIALAKLVSEIMSQYPGIRNLVMQDYRMHL